MAVIDVLGVNRLEASFSLPAEPLSERKGLARWSAWLGKDPPPAPPQTARLHFGLETPTAGSSDQHVMDLKGWVCSPRGPVEFVDVDGPDGRLQRFKVQTPRPDLQLVEPDAAGVAAFGFAGKLTTLGLPLETELQLSAVLHNQMRVPMATVRLRRQGVASGYRPVMQPLLLNAFGHAGAAWTMRLLHEHPQIVVAGAFPYEIRASQYWMRLLHFQAQPAPAESGLHEPLEWLACDPRYPEYPEVPALGQWFGGGYVEGLTAAYQGQIEAFYRQVAQSQDRPGAVYFAEKMQHPLAARLLHELYPQGHELFLVRDFRDVFCSLLAANAPRGCAVFGCQSAWSDDEPIRHFARNVAEFHQNWRQRQDRSLLIRHEDMLLRPHQVLQRICRYLGLAEGHDLLAGMIERAKRADASTEPSRDGAAQEPSIGRWRLHLSTEHQKVFEEVMGEYLAAFGYASDGMCRAA